MKKRTQEEFINLATKIHNNKYSYDKVIYLNNITDVIITCKIHGDFQQTPKMHLTRRGCVSCGYNTVADKKRKSKEYFLQKAIKIHGNKYDYSNIIYTDMTTPIEILCKEHGTFTMLPSNHVDQKQGCRTCGYNKLSENMTHDTETYLQLLKERRGNTKYKYEKVDYVNSRTKITITCPEHGDFEQRPDMHANEQHGCPECFGVGPSKGELELLEFIRSLGLVAISEDKQIINPKHLDIVVPGKKIAFEFNGVFFHSEGIHANPRLHMLNKQLACNKVGYKLVHIYEDEWHYKREVVKKTIAHILGVSNQKLHARKLNIVVKSHSETKQFFEDNHLQGSSRGGICYCLMNNNEIVAAMQFAISTSIRGNRDVYELVRYATTCNIVGGASKLYGAFIKSNVVSQIISYSDNRIFDGRMYEILGFEKSHVTRPDYTLVKGRRRYHKSNFKKSIIAKRYPQIYDDHLTEHQMCLNMNIFRIYNCGLTKWVWTR